MHLLRPAQVEDLPAVLELARYLDSPNLPADEVFIAERLERSVRSFAEPGPPASEREYQFALVDQANRVVGTSLILSKHGTPEFPHLYLQLRKEQREASTVSVRMEHCTFQLQASEDGPSELGALILHPDVRGQPGWLGKLLAWGRFAYIALHPGCFENRLLTELRAKFDEEGRSAFWRAFGKRFTDMPYTQADRLSATDKKFILDLFPDTPFYATLLDPEVEAQLGEVHPEAIPAQRLLEQAGFQWIGEIDPFDAGPFYGAETSQVVPFRETLRGKVGRGVPADDASPCIVSTEEDGTFRAVAAPAVRRGQDILLPKDARKRLGIGDGDAVALTPLPPSHSSRGSRG